MTTASSNNQLPSAGVQPPILTIANYPEWSASMRKNLEAQGLWEVVEARSIPRNSDNWRDKNNSALFTIRSSCDCLILSKIHDICSAKIVWDTLAKMYEMQMHGIYRVDAQQNVIRQVNLADLFKVNLAYLSTLNLGDLSTLSKPPSITVLSNATIWTFEIDRLQYGRMFLAVYKGDWIGLRDELESHGEALNAKVAPHGQLLIHIAARVAKDEITQELARLMARSDLEIQDSWGYTALTYAAFNGMIKTCKFLISLNDKLIYIQNINGYFEITRYVTLASQFSSLYLIIQIYEMKLTHAYALEILRFMLVENALTEAIKNGIVEFVVEIIKACPQRMNYSDMFGRNVIMAAIFYRQEKIYSLIYGLDSANNGWTSQIDFFGNNMLHLAGGLSPESQLANIPGAALQMQRELQWFKEVESLVPPYHKDLVNMEGEKPQQIFDNSHKQLMADGEKWMKECATSSTVVGALIITVMFATIFTVPSGSPLARDKPISSYQKPYLVFIISDSISLFASSNSVLMFLGILTSRYSQEDFLVSLPTKLIIGLSTLFFSIASMMVSFCATLVIVLDEQWHIVIPIVLLASIPVTLFIWLQFPLLVEIFKYTYGPGIFDKKMKQWY
ncbi:hypothetical protein K2173_025118 [Erythroxylum novogranatense]|uniref:PGG domain-containing protein n=1 Tax=Erythroxylum novogranatense TaxID=1862640 RepID=A0AAV8SVH4_9ROSI|nr:hypothetical protein K2173_025118 [Erythroxylum novogranatense]